MYIIHMRIYVYVNFMCIYIYIYTGKCMQMYVYASGGKNDEKCASVFGVFDVSHFCISGWG